MDIWVLLKQTFDTEEKITLVNGNIDDTGVKYIVNPYDEYAVEEAIRIVERQGGKVTVLSIGPEKTGEALRTALAMGADEAVLITDDRIPQDEWAIVHVLTAYLTGHKPDLILGGNFSVDHGAGQVAIRLAHQLDIPHVGSITKLDITADGKAVVQRDAEGDIEIIETAIPALFTAQQGLNEPRYPTLPGIMKAKKKPFRQLTLDDIPSFSWDDFAARTSRLELSLPPARQAGILLKGDMHEQALDLVRRLHEDAKVI
ncbi:electron transfer flavoprotein subunit beta [Paenibacillus selenitireducens]|uniref:Electron transfer flavoprotein subunit beta n=1 Tax=Paenibacillus selenitireducens TaxID=1324314 RepID=A0A1T2XBE0_9BACL|nr:electron transfer flavoprotein subunit beta/FixA family protein [Paenibacillus selenitireducens]OPA76943.1 electron transfer flavoprotein subunit beta [Paenibacillus selenitireducens]